MPTGRATKAITITSMLELTCVKNGRGIFFSQKKEIRPHPRHLKEMGARRGQKGGIISHTSSVLCTVQCLALVVGNFMETGLTFRDKSTDFW